MPPATPNRVPILRFARTARDAALGLVVLLAASAAHVGEGANPARTGPSAVVLKAATAIDDFFSTERHSWRTNTSRLTLRGNADAIDDG